MRWLSQGLTDMMRAPAASLLHGLLVAVGGLLIVGLGTKLWHLGPLLPGALSGFVLIGPILATGLYELSRRAETGAKPTLSDAIHAWRRGTRPLVALGLLLFAAATLWVLFSSLLFKLFVPRTMGSVAELMRYALVEQEALMFWLWLVAGALGAALIFGWTVVSAPLLLDRRIDLRRALATSVRAVGENPGAMLVWAVLIMGLTAVSVVFVFLGFIVTVPLIGHATWHAYRDLVDASAWPARG